MLSFIVAIAVWGQVEIEGVFYALNPEDGTAEVINTNYNETGYVASSYQGDLVIPALLNHEGKAYQVTSVGDRAFYMCEALTSVTLPESLVRIGNNAFLGCTGLTSLVIPDGVTQFGTFCFFGCTSLASVNIPKSMTSIGSAAFYGCSSLTAIDIPEGVTMIENNAFNGCTALETIRFPESLSQVQYAAFENTPWFAAQPDGLVYSGKVLYTYKGQMPADAHIEIAEGTKGIANDALSNRVELKEVVIPGSVEHMGDGAFSGCEKLVTVKMSQGLVSIGERAFNFCMRLLDIEVPYTVCSIGKDAFRGTEWYNLHADGMIYAGGVFYQYKGTMPENTTIELMHATTGIADQAFKDCTGLVSINMPNTVRHIGQEAFAGCNQLTSMVVPDHVASIGSYAFFGCESLSSVTLGSEMKQVGEFPFMTCPNLVKLAVKAVDPPAITYQLMEDTAYETCVLYVPNGSEKAYSIAEGWRDFQKIETLEEEASETEDLNGDGLVDSQDVLNLYQFIMTGGQAQSMQFDINKDGVTDTQDVLMIYQYILNH